MNNQLKSSSRNHQTPADLPPQKKSVFLSIALIIILGFTVYGNSLSGQFIWDDEVLIEKNDHIKHWSNFQQTFMKDIGAGAEKQYAFYRPLQMVTYMVDYSLWKLNARGYHLTNVLLHILTALSIYWLIYTLFKDNLLALLTGSLFVVHPVHTEAVTYISGRADPLALLFMILCFTLYIKNSLSKNNVITVLILLSYACALLSKESSVILPILLLLYHYSFKKKTEIKKFVAVVSVAVIYILLRVTVLKAMLPHSFSETTLMQRLPGFFVAITTYIRLLFLPIHLHMEYGSELFHWRDPRAVLGVILLLALLIYALRNRKNNPLISFAIAWFLVALLPVSNLFPINATMAEHWLYLPSIGFFLIAAKAILARCRVQNFRILTAMFVISLLIFYSTLTIRQNDVWREPLSFYQRTLRYAPNSSIAHNNLGIAYYAVHKYEDAIASYQKAIAIEPDHAESHYNLGNSYKAVNKNEEAIASYKKAIKIKDDYTSAYNNLGIAYHAVHKSDEAINAYKNAIKIKADYADAYFNLANVCRTINKIEEAIASYKKVIEINPHFAVAHNNLALVYFQRQQYRLAIKHCDQAKALGLMNNALLDALKPYRK